MEDDEAQAHGIYPMIPSACSPKEFHEDKALWVPNSQTFSPITRGFLNHGLVPSPRPSTQY